jgi:hypothetical protein
MTGGADPYSPAGRAARVRRNELLAALWGPSWHDVYDDDGEHLARLPDNQIADDGLARAAERVEQLASFALSTRPGGIGAALTGGYRGDTGESAIYQTLRLRYDEQADQLAIETVDDGAPLLTVPAQTLRAGLVERRAER